jgi:pimeloyl-ACP methyl ester carboxylesterase
VNGNRPEDVVLLGDIKVHYRMRGAREAGLPWVFVHGLGEDSATWDVQQRALGRTRRTYAVDVRGHGGTGLGNADGTLRQLGDDLLAFLAAVPGPSVCVGFSMGGAIVLTAAIERSPLVAHAVVVCSSSVVGGQAATRFRDRAIGIDEHGRAFALAAQAENLESAVRQRPADWKAQVAIREAAIGDGAGYGNGSLAMASMHENPLTPALPKIKCRTDVFAGEFDTACPVRAGEMIAGAIPDGHFHVLSGVGHFVNIERPKVLTDALIAL